jgi:DNA-directed RNA polymerase I, II, and III subunit RPABC2
MDSDDEKSIANTEGSEYNDDDNESVGSQKYSDTDNNDSDIDDDVSENGLTNQDNISETGSVIISDDDDDDDDDDAYFEKLNGFSEKTLEKYHPESVFHNYDEIDTLSRVVRDSNNKIIDPFHKTLPIMTKYEKARILGQRAKQIDNSATVFVKIEDNIVDSYKIAEMELSAKKIPFIIKRPLPGGACEYWKVKDLEILGF